jgi:hypothetical protein
LVSSPAGDAAGNRRESHWAWTPSETGYLGIRKIVLTRGVAAIDREYQSTSEHRGFPNGGSEPATARQLLDELLPVIPLNAESRS